MAIENKICKKDIFYLMDKYSGMVSGAETEMLLEYLFNCSRLDLYVKDLMISDTAEELYGSLINRRIRGEPVQYITGCAEFMGLDFVVTRDVLIPRPETEILVDEAAFGFNMGSAKKILDLCTGSGNIAVSLARLMPQAEIAATDISEAALKIAERNAARHDVNSRVMFYKGNLFNALMFAKNPKFDIIVCNPPYIKKDEIPYLQKEVRVEPEIALDGGVDGLDFYRMIAKEAHRYLAKGGSILLEIGFGQAGAVKDIFSLNNKYKTGKTIKDFNGIDRVIWINLS